MKLARVSDKEHPLHLSLGGWLDEIVVAYETWSFIRRWRTLVRNGRLATLFGLGLIELKRHCCAIKVVMR
ncbi:hypothetical protein [Pelosinus fermentans]|uniref:Uncharacterized protein n=1 Tax=Pelosinus fermentans JBW45 TaxID=1192197 RepID=I9DG21_9FIRM|nr:hypothetical protein [Pelosinus fermentans]AJQ26737.1 hypothetical protein JBW_01385 [Pelosinus fermentans JBW45]